jgi:hypothetical protein
MRSINLCITVEFVLSLNKLHNTDHFEAEITQSARIGVISM